MLNNIAPLADIATVSTFAAYTFVATYYPSVRDNILNLGFPTFAMIFVIDTAAVVAVLATIRSVTL